MTREELRNYVEEQRGLGNIPYHVSLALITGIDTLDQEPRWIPVSEPPKKLGTYLIQTDGEYMCECRWTDVNPYWTDKKTKPHWNIFDIPQYSKVVAWMPKPAPFKEESEEQA